MKVIFLGTGTSVGIPTIGCNCRVCISDDPHNRRWRSSLYLEAGGVHAVVDTGPDFREQALRFRIPRVDAVFFTHSHADHIFGFDDLRRFNTIQQTIIPAYGSKHTIADLKRIFDYVHTGEEVPGTYRPRIDFRIVEDVVKVGGLTAIPLHVEHGPKATFGYRFEADGRAIGYVPDCRALPASAVKVLQGVDVMVLDALRHREHTTHLTVTESVRMLSQIGAHRSYLIHMCHDVDHEETQKDLPRGVFVSYDGLTLEW